MRARPRVGQSARPAPRRRRPFGGDYPAPAWIQRNKSLLRLGAGAATFSLSKQLSSWVGACPGEEESAEVSKSHRSPKGNRQAGVAA
ncbi:MAG: transposase [Acidobacteriaceae bacterium]